MLGSLLLSCLDLVDVRLLGEGFGLGEDEDVRVSFLIVELVQLLLVKGC